MMPKEVKYENYIEHGYEEIKKKMLGDQPKSQLKKEKKVGEGENKQVLIEV